MIWLRKIKWTRDYINQMSIKRVADHIFAMVVMNDWSGKHDQFGGPMY